MKKTKLLLSTLLLAAVISFAACSNASSGSDSDKKDDPAKTETPDSTTPSDDTGGNGTGGQSGSGGGNETPKPSYIGRKTPTDKKAVGNIIFTDGSATPYRKGMTLSDTEKQSAIAIIFYVGNECNNEGDTKTVRTLGLGLKQNKEGLEWATYPWANANDKNVYTIQASISAAENPGEFIVSGDNNGIDNLEEIANWSGSVDDTDKEDRYPAFYFGKNYKDLPENNVKNTPYEKGWYLPSLAELVQIKKTSGKSDINDALGAIGGDSIEGCYWSSSQEPDYDSNACFFNLSNSDYGNGNKKDLHPVCVIRDFTNYTVTIKTAENGSLAVSKKNYTPYEPVKLIITPAVTKDFDYKLGDVTVEYEKSTTPFDINTNTFIMPAADVSVSAIFEIAEYIGTKRASQHKAVGDIVFNDGSAIPYTEGLTSEQLKKAIAVIFKADETKSYGTCLLRGYGKWCVSEANGADLNVPEIECNAIENEDGTVTFTGDTDGSDNFEALKKALGSDDDTDILNNYPAFEFAINYYDRVGNMIGTAYESGWYLPSIAELYDLWKAKKIVNAAINVCGGDLLEKVRYFSSSMYEGGTSGVYVVLFNKDEYDYNFDEGDVLTYPKTRSVDFRCIHQFN